MRSTLDSTQIEHNPFYLRDACIPEGKIEFRRAPLDAGKTMGGKLEKPFDPTRHDFKLVGMELQYRQYLEGRWTEWQEVPV